MMAETGKDDHVFFVFCLIYMYKKTFLIQQSFCTYGFENGQNVIYYYAAGHLTYRTVYNLVNRRFTLFYSITVYLSYYYYCSNLPLTQSLMELPDKVSHKSWRR